MPVKKLKEFLDNHSIRYITIIHSPAYTAQETAAYSHTPGKELAKTVMVNVEGKMAMAVLPASFQIDFKRLKNALSVGEVELATELEFKYLFPECEVGAMPPFGNLYGLDVYVDKTLTEDEEIAFNAGSHTELIRLSFDDFRKMVKPKVLEFSTEGVR